MPTQTLESRIESSLLYTREDGTQDFVHDSYRDFFLAKWFAERLNDGRLSVKEAYVNFWSYEEDAKLWGVGGRALLPAWKPILLYIAPMLEPEKTSELIDSISKSYSEAKETLDERKYNPFETDYLFMFILGRENIFIGGELYSRICVPERVILGKPYPNYPNLDEPCYLLTDLELTDVKAYILLSLENKSPEPINSEFELVGGISYDYPTLMDFAEADSDYADFARFALREAGLLNNSVLKEEEKHRLEIKANYIFLEIVMKLSNCFTTRRGKLGGMIRVAHKSLKPQGYNPAVKRLAIF